MILAACDGLQMTKITVPLQETRQTIGFIASCHPIRLYAARCFSEIWPVLRTLAVNADRLELYEWFASVCRSELYWGHTAFLRWTGSAVKEFASNATTPVASLKRMNLRRTFLVVPTVASMLIPFAGTPAHAQTSPIADHHAHLMSPATARLLNEGEIRTSDKPADDEAEIPLTASALIAQLNAAGIRRSVALSAAYRLGSPFVHVPHEAAAVNAENDWTLRQVRMYPGRLVGFCSVNPLRAYALAAIGHCARIGLLGGLKLHLANAEFRFDRPAEVEKLRGVFAAADRLRMPILIHLRTRENWHGRRNAQVFMEKVMPAASDVSVQIAHLGGWGGYDRATDETLSTFAKICEEHPDSCRKLYFDISAVVLPPTYAKAAPGSEDRLLWDEQKDFTDGSERLATNLRRIGLSRILFGTDWPETTANEYIPALRHGLRLSPAEINRVFNNAAPYLPK